MSEATSWISAYERARELALKGESREDLEQAVELFERARELAAAEGNSDRADYESCNQAAVLITLGRAKDTIQPLRSVLERRSGGETGFLAAYNLACAHYATREHGKAAFYARGAIRTAERLDRPDWQAWGHNQLANALLSRDQVTEAVSEYELALELGGATMAPMAKGQLVANLGYCRVLLGHGREAFRDLFAGFRALRRAGATRAVMLGHLDLAFAYLDVGRPLAARRHAESAWTLAQDNGGAEEIRNAAFLLGEAYIASGDEAAARDCFDRIQAQYPDTPYLAELLMAVDVRELVNLRA
jgi:tetratricopeptide (TPR) repeat protein